ncbi:Uncharacterised protein [Mycobacterium tuberculosis]|nr:Uncharacterised protein [Mycobacterium tuberculosis]
MEPLSQLGESPVGPGVGAHSPLRLDREQSKRDQQGRDAEFGEQHDHRQGYDE